MSEFDDYSQDASKRPQSYDPYTGEPIYQAPVYHAASPEQAQPVTYTAPAPAATARKGGGLKTFLLAFAGAALACVLVIAGANVLLGGKGGTTVNLGADGGTSITVSGEDATLPEVVAGKATPSVCCIYVYTQQSSGYSLWGYGGNSNNSSSELTQSSLGSGVILSSDGYVLTNYHVIEGGSELKVSAGGEEYEATVVGSDESSDLAVIKLTDASGLIPIEVGDSDNLIIGEWVMSVGSPFGLESSVATGIVSATSRSQVFNDSSNGGFTVYANLIQTDAAINPGNSGGALVDANGKLIGINTLITSYSGNYSGVGFAIPVNYAIGIAETIIAGETPSHAQLGVTLVSVTSSLAQRYDLPVSSGAYLSSVAAGSGAADADLQVGDIVVKFDGKNITSASDLMVAVRVKAPGDTVSLTFNRDGKEMTADVTLGSDANSKPAIVQERQSSGL